MSILKFGYPTAHKEQYKVYVHCITYNHGKYITDALDGFVMQQTNFQFVCVVYDDASTDGEQDVIRDYFSNHCDSLTIEYFEAELAICIKGEVKNNRNCTLVAYLLKQNMFQYGDKKRKLYIPWQESCEYIALCEGDDYWVDSMKLQKQYDFLDKNPDYSLCFCNAYVKYDDDKDSVQYFSNIENRDYCGEEILSKWIIPTASSFYRVNIINSEIYKKALADKKIIYGDISIFLSCAHEGKIRGFEDTMVVYRRLGTGMVRSMQKSVSNQIKLCNHVKELSVVFGDEYKSITDAIFYERCIIGISHCLKNRKYKDLILFVKMSFAHSTIGSFSALYRILKEKLHSNDRTL